MFAVIPLCDYTPERGPMRAAPWDANGVQQPCRVHPSDGRVHRYDDGGRRRQRSDLARRTTCRSTTTTSGGGHRADPHMEAYDGVVQGPARR